MGCHGNQSLDPKHASVALKKVGPRTFGLLVRVSRYNNFSGEINEMQMSGVSIATCVTSVGHDFEKLNLYIVLVLLSILRRSERFHLFNLLQKEGKNKTCSYYLYDYIHFGGRTPISKQRPHCHLHSVPDMTSEMDI